MMYCAFLVALLGAGAIASEVGQATKITRKGKAVPFTPNEAIGNNCSQVFYIRRSQDMDVSFSTATHSGLYCVIVLRGPAGHKLVLMLMSAAGQNFPCGQDAVRVYSVDSGKITYSAQLCNGSAPNVVTNENVALLTYNSAQNASTRAFQLVVQLLPTYSAPPTSRPTGPFPATYGPFPATYGPFPATYGPFPATYGPFPSTYGPFPATYGPSFSGHGSASYDCDDQPWVVGASAQDRDPGWQDWAETHALNGGNDLASWIARSNSVSHWSQKILPQH